MSLYRADDLETYLADEFGEVGHMTNYAIRTHHNDEGGLGDEQDVEYNMATGDDIASLHDGETFYDAEVRMRLLEAMNINLANLAASAERIAKALEALAQFRAGF